MRSFHRRSAQEEAIQKEYDELLNAAASVGIDAHEIIDGLGLSETASIQDVLSKAGPILVASINARIDEINDKLADAIEERDIDEREFQESSAREAEEGTRTGSEPVSPGRSKGQGAAETTGRNSQTRQGDKASGKGNRAEGLAFELTGQTEAEIKADEAKAKTDPAISKEQIDREAEHFSLEQQRQRKGATKKRPTSCGKSPT